MVASASLCRLQRNACARACVSPDASPLPQVAMGQAAGGAYAVTGLRFLCGDPSCGVADFLNMTASQPPADAAAPSPPLGDSAFIGDWSPWLGRSTPLTTIGICPCPGYIRVSEQQHVFCQVHTLRSRQQPAAEDLACASSIVSLPLQGFSVWYEQGMQATANDTSPISGLTAQCSPGDGLPGASVEVGATACPAFTVHQKPTSTCISADHIAADRTVLGVVPGLRERCCCALPALQVFPGQGPPDASLNFTSGLKNVTVRLGQYLDSLMGVGGSGPTVVRSCCRLQVQCRAAGPAAAAAAPLCLPEPLPCLGWTLERLAWKSHCSAADGLQLQAARPSDRWTPSGLGALAHAAWHCHCHRRPAVLLWSQNLPVRLAGGRVVPGKSLAPQSFIAIALAAAITSALPALAAARLVALAGPGNGREHHGHLPLPRLHPGAAAAPCLTCTVHLC